MRIGLVFALGLSALVAACAMQTATVDETGKPDADLRTIADRIVAACPRSAADKGVAARDQCADRLARLGSLANAMPANSVVWGGTVDGQFDPAKDKLTQLDSLVWRKLYLSLFSFGGGYKIEDRPNGDKLLRIEARIRPIAPEEFPYPFWHSAAKWQDYQQSRQVALLFRNRVLVAAYRNGEEDRSLPFPAMTWDGNWTWTTGGKPGPRVALYTYSLSAQNPNRAALETAYRDFEAASRPYMCASCHNPANPKGINPLMFFTHPSQALVARHDIVTQLEANKMPPPNGIKDDAERQKLIALAKTFADVGDKALAFEKTRLASR